MYDIYQESIENKILIVVEVFPGNDTPYFIKSFGKENGTFIRLDATTRNADITTIDELELRGKRRYYDELPLTELDVTENDIATLCNEFSKRAKHEITTETLAEAIIRELILNAVIHRNYMMSSCVQVAVYDDRVEISSPGSLFGTLTLQEALSGRSSIRNKVIAGVCEKLGVVEGWGLALNAFLQSAMNTE